MNELIKAVPSLVGVVVGGLITFLYNKPQFVNNKNGIEKDGDRYPK